MIIRHFIIAILLLQCSCTKAQSPLLKIDKIEFNSQDSTYGHYLAVVPKSNKIKGTIVLLPGFGQKAADVFRDSKLHQFAYENDLLTIAYTTGMKMFADTFMQTKLNEALSHALSKYNLDKTQFAFGGFSAGGNICLRYVELCKQYPDRFPVNPMAVFMADAPTDIFHSWNNMQALKKAGNSEIAVNEANWVEKMYKGFYGTTPAEDPAFFQPFNPFSFNEKNGHPEKYLMDVAVRAYHDVDIPWRLKNRNQSVKHSNYMVTAELINRLLILGNKKAEFIQTYQTGYRANGQRHPHSWSIIDEKDCIQWILENINS